MGAREMVKSAQREKMLSETAGLIVAKQRKRAAASGLLMLVKRALCGKKHKKKKSPLTTQEKVRFAKKAAALLLIKKAVLSKKSVVAGIGASILKLLGKGMRVGAKGLKGVGLRSGGKVLRSAGRRVGDVGALGEAAAGLSSKAPGGSTAMARLLKDHPDMAKALGISQLTGIAGIGAGGLGAASMMGGGEEEAPQMPPIDPRMFAPRR
jgi:hypothetical protein